MASICDKDIPLRLHNIDAFIASYRNSLHSLRATALEAARSQSELAEVKAKLREAEDELVKALAVKTRREAKRMALKEAIVSVKGRIEDLKTSIQKQRTQNEECATVVSHHRLVLEVSEQKSNESSEHRDEVQEAISWYNRILGFQIEGGRGVKFSFKNINVDNPNEEFFFTIRHEDDVYTCRLSMTTNEHQESAFISASGPVLSISTITEDNDHQDEPTKGNAHLQKQVNRRRVKSAILSPGSASSVRQSPRLKVSTQILKLYGDVGSTV
uniref:Kinetochore protein SPC25 n=1 Tax=Glycine max TaxID=3847 RepID=A0A0R0K9W8_SOYBN